MEVAYETYAYSTAVSTLQSFTTFLSNVYLDVSKDRLYIESPSSAERRACQTVVAGVVERLLSCIAPVTPHMAEEAWMALPYAKVGPVTQDLKPETRDTSSVNDAHTRSAYCVNLYGGALVSLGVTHKRESLQRTPRV